MSPVDRLGPSALHSSRLHHLPVSPQHLHLPVHPASGSGAPVLTRTECVRGWRDPEAQL